MKTKNQWWIVGGVLAVLVVATVVIGKSTLFEGALVKVKKLPSGLFNKKTIEVIQEKLDEKKSDEKKEEIKKPAAEEKKSDLSVKEYSYDASRANGLLKVTYRNEGSADTNREFSVTAKTINGNWKSTVNVPSLKKGAEGQIHFFPNTEGTNDGKAVAIIVDSLNEIKELNEENNKYETSPLQDPEVETPRANLVIKSVEFERLDARNVNIKFTVKNDGEQGSLPTVVFSVKVKAETGEWESNLVLVSSLASNEKTDVVIPVRNTDVTVSTRYLITVDATDVVRETDEQDNKKLTDEFRISTGNPVTIAVSAYDPLNNNATVPGATVYMFRVTPRNTGGYRGEFLAKSKTGNRGQGASFSILPNETVNFVAMKTGRNLTAWDFVKLPFKNFSEVDGEQNRLCQIDYGGNDRFCVSSLNYPTVDQNATARVQVYARGAQGNEALREGFVNMHRVASTSENIQITSGVDAVRYRGDRVETKRIEEDGYAHFTIKPGDVVDFVGFAKQANATSARFRQWLFENPPMKNFTGELSHAGFCSVNDPMICNNRMSASYSLPAVDQDVEISVTAYRGNAGVPLANAAVTMYVVNGLTPSAPIVRHSIITTGANGEGAKFKVQIGETVQFKAYSDFQSAQRNTRPTFTTAPYANFGPKHPGKFCVVGKESGACNISTLNIPIFELTLIRP